jgi:predicted ATPase
VLLIGGEPGIGKSQLLADAVAMTAKARPTVLQGRAYEAEAARPYGPWIDALRKLPAVAVGETIGADLASLVPELFPSSSTTATRDRMFGAVVELIASRAHSTGSVLMIMDDAHWFDEASAELLHYVIRLSRHRPLLVLLAARPGELPDNAAMSRVLRSLRRDSVLEQITLGPLGPGDAAELARQIEPSLKDAQLLADAAGNPLFLIELLRTGAGRVGSFSGSLVELVKDRVERLTPPAPEVLRWGTILGSTFTADAVTELAGIDPEQLIDTLELLERHGLILPESASPADSGAVFRFAHDLVRKIIYTDISEPRRRIMHGRVAAYLVKRQEQNESLTPDVVQHAALANDARLAANACAAAGKRCLRLFANVQAETFARRGMRFAEQLVEPERIKLLVELSCIAVEARRPDALEASAAAIELLAEQALDHGCMAHARLAFDGRAVTGPLPKEIHFGRS